uniref:Ribonuclease Z n=1 Tax=Candidatus Methanophaga sp. ANME-1 ERB7 TaxID=2759913 RepID=A0A7G9ZBH5_9EURY|nr:ribonuclease Z [Methanosarcinales archaeon ANME-1 ERB7]
MILTFLGVGEAFGQFANTSILVDGKLLLDCGPHTLLQLRKQKQDLKEIELVFLSHFHGDHTLGLPALLLASREEDRVEELKIFGPSGLREKIEDLLEISYRKSIEDLSFELDTFEVPDLKEGTTHKDYKLEFAQTTHSIECCSVAISKSGEKMTYTSDGAPTEDTVSIASDSDILIAEAYGEGFSGHSSAVKAAELAFRSHSKSLALVHISRNTNRAEELEKAKRKFKNSFLPTDSLTVTI